VVYSNLIADDTVDYRTPAEGHEKLLVQSSGELHGSRQTKTALINNHSIMREESLQNLWL